jgi:phosphoglucosamine mutase
MTRKKKYFGTDGIRGEVGKTAINPEFMLKLGWAAGKVFRRHQDKTSVLIGKDTRVSGYMLESALQAGFSAAGVNTLLLGPMPTPAIAYLTHSVRAHAGVVISASHNPYQDNGIKFFDADGFKLADELEFEIEDLMDQPLETVAPEALGKATRMVDAGGRYIEFCKSTFPNSLSLRNLRIVLDCAHGATYAVAPKIFHELGADIITIGNKPDGFNINRQCGATHLAPLADAVLEQKAALGIAFDGDGDRVIMVDHRGEVVDGDELLGIIALHGDYLGLKPQGIVGTVMTNLGLEQALLAKNIRFVRAKVGDRHVLESLQEQGWWLGGEASGHIVDLNLTTTGDGIVTALQILTIMQSLDQPLADLKRVVIKRPQVLLNIPTPRGADYVSHPQIMAKVTEIETRLADRGRVLLRASGTEPLTRVMVEGNDANEVQAAAEEIAQLIQSMIAAVSSEEQANAK